MKFFKNPFKRKVSGTPNIFVHREAKNPLTREKTLKKIAKRTFRLNAPINWLGKLTHISKAIWIAVIIGLFLTTTYGVFFTEIFNIKKLVIYEGEKESTNLKVRKIVEPLRNRNLFLFNKTDLEATIKEQVDNISSLSIQRILPNTLIVRYNSFKNIANITNVVGPGVKKNFIINENGLLVEQDKISSTLPTINIPTDKAYSLGDQILKSADLKYILDARSFFEEKFNLKVNEINYLPKPKEIRLITAKGFQVWLDMLVGFKEQIMKLKNAIPKINIYDGGLQYVDLRIQSAEGQKIIYK